MSSWMQYDASKLAYQEQKLRDGRRAHRPAMQARARWSHRLAAWCGALLLGFGQRLMWYGRRGPHSAALQSVELQHPFEEYRLN